MIQVHCLSMLVSWKMLRGADVKKLSSHNSPLSPGGEWVLFSKSCIKDLGFIWNQKSNRKRKKITKKNDF